MKRIIKIEYSLDTIDRTKEEIDANNKYLLWFVITICSLGVAFAMYMTFLY